MFYFIFFTAVSATVIGIDMSSELFKVTFMQISLIRPGKKLLIVENEQSKRSTPSAIAFTEQGREYGYNAIKEQLKKPESSVLFFHNLFGNVYTDESYFLRTFQPLELRLNENRNSTVVRIGSEDFETEEIMAMLLLHAKEMSEKFGEGTIKDCAITVPSFWTRGQRLSIINAASSIGLNVLALMHENTGAAFYYGIDRLDNQTDHYSLFYNLGASYLQVTLAKYSSAKKTVTTTKQIENVEILAHASDSTLGGSLFDSLIAEYLAGKFFEKHALSVLNVPRAMARLLQQSNHAKKTLSANKATYVAVNSIYKGIDFSYTLTREEFEKLLEPYTARLINPIVEVLEKAGIDIKDVDTLEVIGGVSRIPRIQEIIKEKTGKDIGTHLNGDESMAHGAAIYAANFSTVVQVRPMWLSDITTKTYTAVFYSESNPEWNKETILFKYGSKLGARKKIMFAFNQDLRVRIEEVIDQQRVPLVSYDVTGVEDLDKPDLSLYFTFLLDYSGIPSLNAADAKFEVEVKKKIKKASKNSKKKFEKNETDLYNATDTETQSVDINNTDDEKISEKIDIDLKTLENSTADTENLQFDTKNTETEPATSEKNFSGTQSEKKNAEEQSKVQEEYFIKENKTVSLRLSETDLEQPKLLQKTDLKKIHNRIESFKEAELQSKKIAEAKNDIESYVYYVSDRLEDANFQKVTSEGQRESLSESIASIKDWMESSDFETASAHEIKRRKKELEPIVTDALQREKELEVRDSAIQKAYKVLGRLQDTLINLNKTKPWIPIDTMVLSWIKLNDTLKWIENKAALQKKLKDWEPLAFRTSELDSKVLAVEKQVEKLKRMTKPKSKVIFN